MGGGRRGQRSRPDTDSSVSPSFGSFLHPHFPPPLAASSILCRPSVLAAGVVPLPQLGVIASPSPAAPETLSARARGWGLLCLGGFFLRFIGGQSREKGFRVPERRLPPAAYARLACRRVSEPSLPLSPNHDRNEREGERAG